MIGFLPCIYPDELVYSWFARYYAHSGHPAYVSALENLMHRKNTRPDVEFISKINKDARNVITKMVSMEELILKHTMFPFYRFTELARLSNALKSISENGGDAYQFLPVSKGKRGMQAGHVRYCPLCAAEARGVYGEAFWARKSIIRNVDICVRHKCRLKDTGIEISAKQSPRLYVAEMEIQDLIPELMEVGLEFKLAEYMLEVFQSPIDFKNEVPVGDFLRSRLEGTKYLSPRGMQMHISLLVEDLMGFYEELQEKEMSEEDVPGQDVFLSGITQGYQIQHILSNKNTDFYRVCQLAFFLDISPEELTNPGLPRKTQTELYNEQVAELYSQGLGCHRIAEKVGGSPSTVGNANKTKEKKSHDYAAARKGKQAEDWEKMDEEMLPEVEMAVKQIYGSGSERPKRVTEYAVTKYMDWPERRLNYLPKCRELVKSYYEDFPVYWAREIVWCYQELLKTKEENNIHWRDIRTVTNLRNENFKASFPYLGRFTDAETAEKIKSLLP